MACSKSFYLDFSIAEMKASSWNVLFVIVENPWFKEWVMEILRKKQKKIWKSSDSKAWVPKILEKNKIQKSSDSKGWVSEIPKKKEMRSENTRIQRWVPEILVTKQKRTGNPRIKRWVPKILETKQMKFENPRIKTVSFGNPRNETNYIRKSSDIKDEFRKPSEQK